MIYEVRTYTLRPGGAVAEFEERFAKRLPLREKHSKLGAFWHTEFGPLNQVIHVYPYEDLQQRTAVRAALAQDTARQQLPGGGPDCGAGVRDHESGAVYAPWAAGTTAPATCMRCGPTPTPRATSQRCWRGWSAIEAREKFSPLAACWTSELGGLNKFVHIWVYKDLNERTRVREASRQAGGPWPPQTGYGRSGRTTSC